MQVKSYKIKPVLKKENGLWCLDLDAIKLPKNFKCKKRYILRFPPRTFGGNHKHSNTEVFIAIGQGMELHWLDENKRKHIEQMNPKGQLFVFLIKPGIPHAVINNSLNREGVLIEFSDSELKDIEEIKII